MVGLPPGFLSDSTGLLRSASACTKILPSCSDRRQSIFTPRSKYCHCVFPPLPPVTTGTRLPMRKVLFTCSAAVKEYFRPLFPAGSPVSRILNSALYTVLALACAAASGASRAVSNTTLVRVVIECLQQYDAPPRFIVEGYLM